MVGIYWKLTSVRLQQVEQTDHRARASTEGEWWTIEEENTRANDQLYILLFVTRDLSAQQFLSNNTSFSLLSVL